MEINRQNVDVIMGKILEAIEPIAKKENISIEYTGGTYDESTAHCRLTIVSEPGLQKKRAADFLAVCGAFGIKKDALGKTFKHQNTDMIFLGIDTTKRKTPIIAVTVKGKIEYHLPETDQIKKQLNR